MKNDLAKDFLRLAGQIDRSACRVIRPEATEPPYLDIRDGDALRWKTIGGDEHMRATRRRFDDNRAAFGAEPGIAAPGFANDLGTTILLIWRRRDLHCRQLHAGYRSLHALGRTNFQDVKTLLERDQAGHCRRLIQARERHLCFCVGRLEAAGLDCLDHNLLARML